MNKDEHYWTAMLLPQEHTNGELNYAVKLNCEKLALGLLDKLSDGKEYAVKMISPQTIPNIERGTTEIRTAINMREIVRCKDCKYHEDGWETKSGRLYCEYAHITVSPMGFCADGERKTE